MYPIAIVGNDIVAWAAYRACRLAGFHQVELFAPGVDSNLPEGLTLPANQTRVIHALECQQALAARAWSPSRAQQRFAKSTYLLSELPLGKFSEDRYHAPHVNIERDQLLALLRTDEEVQPATDLTRLQKEFGVVLVTQLPDQNPVSTHPQYTGPENRQAEPTSRLWHARLPVDADMATANISWLGPTVTGWQFTTKEHTHFYFAAHTHDNDPVQTWHPRLRAWLDRAQPVSLPETAPAVREYWHEGNLVYLGEACLPPLFFYRETMCSGLEDVWVLSRMLENYEEDIHDGLHQYQRYRKPRMRKIARAGHAETLRRMQHLQHPGKRFLAYLKIALNTRFLPEIAMQQLDWLYGYDCVRGFR